MAADLELESWRRSWQTAARVPPDLKSHVERETRWMRLGIVLEVLVTLVFGGGSLAWAVRSQRTDVLVLAIGIWVFIAIAWTISFLLRRDAWTPAALSTAAFLDLLLLRCKRRREALVAQCVLYPLILTFDLSWIYFANAADMRMGVVAFLTSTGVAWVWVVTAVLAVAAVRQRQKLARELESLTHLRTTIGSSHDEAEDGGRLRR